MYSLWFGAMSLLAFGFTAHAIYNQDWILAAIMAFCFVINVKMIGDRRREKEKKREYDPEDGHA